MKATKYFVYLDGDDRYDWFDEEIDAINYAQENGNKNTKIYKVEGELSDDGFDFDYEEANKTPVEFSLVPPEETHEPVADDDFDVDFPDIPDVEGSDDPDYDEMAKQYVDDQNFDPYDADEFDGHEDFDVKEALEKLEENEDEVECKNCFDLFPKAECIKTEHGYLCKKCNQELHSHQGTNLDLIDENPFDLDYDDPRLPEEKEEAEVKEEPVNANEVRKFEAGIKEELKKKLNTERDVFDYYYNNWLDCEVDYDELYSVFELGLEGKKFPANKLVKAYGWGSDYDYLDSMYDTGKDIHDRGLEAVIDEMTQDYALDNANDPNDQKEVQTLKEYYDDPDYWCDQVGPRYLVSYDGAPVFWLQYRYNGDPARGGEKPSDEQALEDAKFYAAEGYADELKPMENIDPSKLSVEYQGCGEYDGQGLPVIEESLKEHINDRPADIESDQENHGVDNAVVDCKKYTLVAHSEDEKPVDCKLEKPALEEPLAGEEVDGKFYEHWSDALVDEDYGLEEAKKEEPVKKLEIVSIVDEEDKNSDRHILQIKFKDPRYLGVLTKLEFSNSRMFGPNEHYGKWFIHDNHAYDMEGNLLDLTYDQIYSDKEQEILKKFGPTVRRLNNESLNEGISPVFKEMANEFEIEFFDGSLENAKTDFIHDLQDKGIKVTYTTWLRELIKAFLKDKNNYSETRAHLLERAIIALHKDLKDEFNFLKKECNESLKEDSHTVQSYKDWINEPTFAEDKDDVIEDIKNNKCLTDGEKLELLAMISKKTESLTEAKKEDPDFEAKLEAEYNKRLDKYAPTFGYANGEELKAAMEANNEVYLEVIEYDDGDNFLDLYLNWWPDEEGFEAEDEYYNEPLRDVLASCLTEALEEEAKRPTKRLAVIEPGYQYKDEDGSVYTLYGDDCEEDNTGISYEWDFLDNNFPDGDIVIFLNENLQEAKKTVVPNLEAFDCDGETKPFFRADVPDDGSGYGPFSVYINPANKPAQPAKWEDFEWEVAYVLDSDGDDYSDSPYEQITIDECNVSDAEKQKFVDLWNASTVLGEGLQEAKKDEDEELPPDPGAVKVEVHSTLNNLVADEIEAIDGYEEAKADIQEQPIEHKDEIIATIDHIKDEEKEHIDELINATSKIPFEGGAKEEAPVIEKPVLEEPIAEPAVEEDFDLATCITSDPVVKVGDTIKITKMDDPYVNYVGKTGKVEHIDDAGQLHGTWGGCAVIPGEDKFEIVNEELTEAKEPGNKEADYEAALKLAALHNKPVIYGYSNKAYAGKYFSLDDPIVCKDLFDETKKFKQKYKTCGTTYVAYPDDYTGLKESYRFSEEEQKEYNCDEDGCYEENGRWGRLVKCGWCEDFCEVDDCKFEADFGWLCDSCQQELETHGGPLMFIEPGPDSADEEDELTAKLHAGEKLL